MLSNPHTPRPSPCASGAVCGPPAPSTSWRGRGPIDMFNEWRFEAGAEGEGDAASVDIVGGDDGAGGGAGEVRGYEGEGDEPSECAGRG